jgi:hypothetical protein
MSHAQKFNLCWNDVRTTLLMPPGLWWTVDEIWRICQRGRDCPYGLSTMYAVLRVMIRDRWVCKRRTARFGGGCHVTYAWRAGDPTKPGDKSRADLCQR